MTTFVLRAPSASPSHGPRLSAVITKFRDDPLFRRLAIGSPTFGEMIAQAILGDRDGVDYHLAPVNTPGVDLTSDRHGTVQVKTMTSPTSFVPIDARPNMADTVVVITCFPDTFAVYVLPMDDFKAVAMPRDRKGATVAADKAVRWEISAARFRRGEFARYQLVI